MATIPALKNPRDEAFAQALARGTSAAAAYGQVGISPHRANAATLARKQHISVRVADPCVPSVLVADDLSIPAFLKREPAAVSESPESFLDAAE